MKVNKVIFSDLDGTLLDYESKISADNKEAIIQALDLGHQFYIATGRPYYFAKDIANQIDPRVRVIAFNGAVYEVEENYYSERLTEEEFRDIKFMLDPYNGVKLYKTFDTVYFDGEMHSRFTYDALGVMSIQGSHQCPTDSLIKVLVLENHDDEVDISKLVSKLEEKYEVSYYKDNGFELIKKNINKGTSILKVMKQLNRSIEDAIVFGDAINDESMFKLSCKKIATNNAIDRIKELADYISVDCSESAIAHALKELKVIRGEKNETY